jgi:pimeloyl-ACP methyl ester carboxylesterase
MPWICTPAFPAGCAPGVKSGPWFHPDMDAGDERVPLTVRRHRLDPGATDRIPLRGRENFGYVIAGSAAALAAPEAPAANMAAMTLAGAAARARVPLLQLYGGNDPGSPPADGERIAAEYGGPVTTVIYPDGVHILNNLWYQARPLVADWLAETL